MTNINDYVIDYETMATQPDTVVLCCAITRFVRGKIPDWDTLMKDTVFFKLDINSQVGNRAIDQDTLDWWDRQPKELKDRLFLPSTEDISMDEFVEGIKSFFEKYPPDNKSVLFCRGAEFDHPITADVIRKHGGGYSEKFKPIPFWNRKCLRSYIGGLVMDPNVDKVPFAKGHMKEFEKHNPVHDNIRAAFHIRFAEFYAMGLEGAPEEENIDPNSML